jgi:hypothetical protein
MQASSFFVRRRIVSLQGFGSEPGGLERKDRKTIGKNRSFRVCQNHRNKFVVERATDGSREIFVVGSVVKKTPGDPAARCGFRALP